MSIINYAGREITVKIVYYGPGLGGKTTNVEQAARMTPPDRAGKLMALATQSERTLFFDFFPLNLGEVRGFTTRLNLFTVPGQVYYQASRKLILRGVDGVVFVADSQVDRMDANLESMYDLYQNMQTHDLDVTKTPFVIQYNKRDLPTAMPIDQLEAALNPGWPILEPERQQRLVDPTNPQLTIVDQLADGQWIGRAPYVEAVAASGDGVMETLKVTAKLVLKSLS